MVARGVAKVMEDLSTPEGKRVTLSPTTVAAAPRMRPLSSAVAWELQERGFAVVKLSSAERQLLRDARLAAKEALSSDEAQACGLAKRMVHRPDGTTKTILNLGPSPLHSLKVCLQLKADTTMDDVCDLLGVERAHLRTLVGAHEQTLLSAMRYDAGGGCEEHEDRGLLTLVCGQATLEVYDRVERSWVTPCEDGNSIVIMTGATLHRATAGLVPAAVADDETVAIGATRHRVPTGSSHNGAARLSLVLRVRARPEARLDCESLRGRPGAIERFVTRRDETVGDFIDSQAYTSVNESVKSATVSVNESASAQRFVNDSVNESASAQRFVNDSVNESASEGGPPRAAENAAGMAAAAMAGGVGGEENAEGTAAVAGRSSTMAPTMAPTGPGLEAPSRALADHLPAERRHEHVALSALSAALSAGCETVQSHVAMLRRTLASAEDKALDLAASEALAQLAAEKTTDEAKKTLDEAEKTTDEAKKTLDEAEKTTDEAEKAANEAEKTTDEAEKVANEAEKAADEAEKTTNEAEKTTDEAEKAANETEKAADEAEKTTDEAEKTTDDAEKAANDAEKAADEAEKARAMATRGVLPALVTPSTALSPSRVSGRTAVEAQHDAQTTSSSLLTFGVGASLPTFTFGAAPDSTLGASPTFTFGTSPTFTFGSAPAPAPLLAAARQPAHRSHRRAPRAPVTAPPAVTVTVASYLGPGAPGHHEVQYSHGCTYGASPLCTLVSRLCAEAHVLPNLACLAQRVAGQEYYEELRPLPTGLMPSLVKGSELILAWRPGAAAARAESYSDVKNLALLQSMSSDFDESDEEEDESTLTKRAALDESEEDEGTTDRRVTLVKCSSLSPKTMCH